MLHENASHQGSVTAPSSHLDFRAGLWNHRQNLEAQWGPRADAERCPNPRLVLLDTRTGEIKNQTLCRRSTCLYCNRVRAREYHRAIDLAAPSQGFTLTLVDGDRQASRNQVKQVVRTLRRSEGLNVSVAWALECNPGGTGHHAHGWLRGDHVRPKVLTMAAARAGLGSVHVQPVTYRGDFSYPMKSATHNQRSLTEHLRLNGPELLHARHFWFDPRSGEALTRDQAVQRSRPRRQALPTHLRWMVR